MIFNSFGFENSMCNSLTMKLKLTLISLILVVIVSLIVKSDGSEDLYSILGVSKTSSLQEIKRAYKTLAREWHPDKNKHPSANDKFMKINEAYETLSDEEKRSHYDRYGTTTAENAAGHGFGDSPFGHGATFTFNGFPFNFGRANSVNSKNRITLRLYENNILPESHRKPYLIYVYTSFCFHCNMVAPVWEQIEDDLSKIGMGVGVFDAQLDGPLSRKLRISNVPAVIAVNCGKLQWFSGKHFTHANLREFVRMQYPAELVVEVNSKNINEFLEGWRDNKVRMLMFDTRKQPCLRFVAAAFEFRDRVLAGYVNMARMADGDNLFSSFHITRSQENLLIFNENTRSPAASIAMSSISRNAMDEVIQDHKYLTLPRLSSQSMFNYVCPVTSSVRDRKLCVLLLSRNSPEHEAFRESYRHFVSRNENRWNGVRFAYVYEDAQPPFVRSVTWGRGVVNETIGTLKVVVVWRRDGLKIQFDYLDDGWYKSGEELLLAERKLVQLIDLRAGSSERLTYGVELTQEFIDEHALPLLRRIIRRLGDYFDTGLEKILSIDETDETESVVMKLSLQLTMSTNIDETTLVTIFTTACVIVVVGLMMRIMFNSEQERVASFSRSRSNGRPARTDAAGSSQPEKTRPVVNLVPLCSVNYNQLVVNGPTGVRLIVLLLDEPSKARLLQHYASTILPYCRSDNLKFAFLQLEQYIGWYRSLLESTSEFNRSIDRINVKNCIGTVLAISGPHRCYWMFHASTERVLKAGKASRENSSFEGLRNRRGGTSSGTGGKFLGLEDSSDSDNDGSVKDTEKLFESDLLRGLYMWLDRLCEGTLQRFKVTSWPEMVAEDNGNLDS